MTYFIYSHVMKHMHLPSFATKAYFLSSDTKLGYDSIREIFETGYRHSTADQMLSFVRLAALQHLRNKPCTKVAFPSMAGISMNTAGFYTPRTGLGFERLGFFTTENI